MQKYIDLRAQKIPYTLKRSARAKRIKIAVHCGDAFVLTLPRYTDEIWGERFIKEKEEWILEKLRYFRGIQGNMVRVNDRARYREHKSRALALVTHKITEANARYNLKYKSIAIRNQKTLWGSCSRDKCLSFNYKIAFLREELADYLIVHELCHLQEMNHSDRFWRLVAKTIPNYATLRRELKKKSLIFY